MSSSSLRLQQKPKKPLTVTGFVSKKTVTGFAVSHSMEQLIWDANYAHRLRVLHKIVPVAIGMKKMAKKAPEYNLPVRLFPAQILVGLEKGFIEMPTSDADVLIQRLLPNASACKHLLPEWIQSRLNDTDDTSTDRIQVYQYLVFADLWAKDFFVTNGSRFAADFLIYLGDPLLGHAAALIIICDEKTHSDAQIIRFGRMANMVHKKAIFACINESNGQVQYETLLSEKLSTGRFKYSLVDGIQLE